MATERLIRKKKEIFIERFRDLASVTAAARAAKIDRGQHYRWLREDREYAKQFTAAQDVAADALEDEAVRRAHEGTERPVFQGGKLVGTIREYSDPLLIFLLKALRPKKYRDKFIVLPPDGKNTPGGIFWVGNRDDPNDPPSGIGLPDRFKVVLREPPDGDK